MSLDFGSLRKDRKKAAKRGTSPGGTAVSRSDEIPSHEPRRNYRKMYETTKKSLDEWKKRAEKWRQDVNRLHDENLMLRQQEVNSKKALDIMSQEVERYKFRPQQYSKIIQILNCLQINTNPKQRERLEQLVGDGNSIYAVRDAIIELLEDPYK